MAINLATKYEKKLATLFYADTVTDKATNGEYNWNGVKSINLLTPVTQPLVDYQRSGSNRYGAPWEMEDTRQELPLRKDRAFSFTIDKGNNTEQMNVKDAARMLKAEMDEQANPEIEKYNLGQFIDNAGTIESLANAPSKSNIVGYLSDAMVKMSNKSVPAKDRFIFLSWSAYGALRQAPEFLSIDKLGEQALVKGALGTFMGAQVIPVVDDWLKRGTYQCYFVVAHRKSCVAPKKIRDMFIKHNPPGINGALVEGRFIYDAYVIGAKADGVYAGVATGSQQTAVTFAFSTPTLTVTSASASKILVTTDGTDPRYSPTAISTTSGGTITLPSGTTTARAVAYGAANFPSAVAKDTARTVT